MTRDTISTSYFNEVTIDKKSIKTALAARYKNAKTVKKADIKDFYKDGKKKLHIQGKYGESLHYCSSMSDRYICCATHVLRSISNCPYNCTYCFLQNYLNDGTIKVVADIPALINDVKKAISSEPWRFFRIGTWELGDSLALESILGTAGELVTAFANIPEAILDFRTKSDCVDSILNLKHNGRTVVSWTMNPQKIIDMEELGTASLNARIAALKKVAKAGYKVAIHFDPMIYIKNFKEEYDDLVRTIFKNISPDIVTWISMGVLRFNPEMKKQVEQNYPGSKITSAEMISGDDGKVRYVKPLRLEMLSSLYKSIKRYAGDGPYVYLCMERKDIWQRVMGYSPDSIGDLNYSITKSLYERFKGLVPQMPIRQNYIMAQKQKK
jgi:spore photoproduct lyase